MPTFIEEKRQQIVRFIQERQTTIASGLAALLIIVVGFLIFNFFLRVNKDSTAPTTTTVTEEATATGDLAVSPTPEASTTPTSQNNDQGQVSSEGAAATNLPQEITVQKGDTLGSIAQKYYNSSSKWSEIAKANNLSNPNLIHPGNKLNLPKVETGTVASATTVKETPVTGISSGGNVEYIVSTGDTLWQIAQNYYGSGFEWYRIKDANPNLVGTLANGRPLITSGQHLAIP